MLFTKVCYRAMFSAIGGAPPALTNSSEVYFFASPQPTQDGQQNMGKPQVYLDCFPSVVIDMVPGAPTAWVITAFGYLARISFSMRFRLFITQPPVGHELMQIFCGALMAVDIDVDCGYLY
jgi:hypothetical protein